MLGGSAFEGSSDLGDIYTLCVHAAREAACEQEATFESSCTGKQWSDDSKAVSTDTLSLYMQLAVQRRDSTVRMLLL